MRRPSIAVLLPILLLLLLVSPASADRFADQLITTAGQSESAEAPAATASAGPSVTRVLTSLAIVGLLIVVLGWGWKRFMPVGGRSPGAQAVRVAAQVQITPKHQVFVLSVGSRLLVVGDSGHGMNPLATIDDPEEAASVLAQCGKAEAAHDPVKADAFSATLAEAEDDLDGDDGYGNIEVPPEGPVGGEDVRSLIERVRGLTAQHSSDSTFGGAR
jgi:flagellar biogenesis protein FliO